MTTACQDKQKTLLKVYLGKLDTSDTNDTGNTDFLSGITLVILNSYVKKIT